MACNRFSFALIVILALALSLVEGIRNTTLLINGAARIGRVDESFICATLDWWPADKCDYGTCSWAHASLLDLDLTNPVLEKAVKALYPLRLRLGGSLQDRIIYNVGNIQSPCLPIVKHLGGLFGFSEGCLNMSRWDSLNVFFQKTGAVVAFGLNALYGRTRTGRGTYIGAWDSTNAHAFIKYTVDRGYKVQAWELGNELSGPGIGASVSAQQYAADLRVLRTIINGIYESLPDKPLIVAPDGFFLVSWYQQLLQSTGPDILNACSRHVYNLGAGVDQHLVQKILNPTYLSQEAGAYRQMRDTLQKYGPWAQAWIGEAGGAYNSGKHLVTDAFISSFWYLDQLGMAASHNTAVYCRQSLVGGNYALLNTATFHPNPDYYSALLWQRLMGRDALASTLPNILYLRAYTHCSKEYPGGMSVLLINLSNSTQYDVNLSIYTQSYAPVSQSSKIVGGAGAIVQAKRMEYHLAALNNNLQDQIVMLNGQALQVTSDGNLPSLNPKLASPEQPISVAPLSIVFAVVPDASVPACPSPL